MQLFTIIEIETHNLCTRKCWFCKHGQVRQDESTAFMPDDLIRKISDNLQDLGFRGRISPYSINEPFLDPRIPDIIRLFRSKCPESFISLASNGDLLSETLYQSLLVAGLDALGLSVYDDSSWKRLKAYACYSDVRIIDYRRRKFENRGGEVKRGTFSPLTDRSCHRPFGMMVIRATGDVVLCCSDMYSDVVIGNVVDQRLEEIWESEKFQRYRSLLLSPTHRKGLKLCQACSHDGSACLTRFPSENFEWIPEPLRGLLYRWTPPGVRAFVKRTLGKE
ncbi:MAG TPA: SPASM domain-containing protein [Thermodesulfovibrionales bacterium]|nr:SPASM domain-containing protein [Thermodesulfovibrionales bacterium]